MKTPTEININLLEPQPWVQPRMFYWGLLISALAVMVIIVGYLFILQNRQLTDQQAINTKLKAETKNHEKDMNIFKPIEEMSKEMASRGQKVEALEKMRVSYLEVITEIDKVVPANIMMAGIDIKAQTVIMNGFSPDHSQVARLLEGLKASPRFKNVAVLSSQIDEKTNEAKFTVEMDWEAEKK
jgi:Tfp pilus assembly protein PilN